MTRSLRRRPVWDRPSEKVIGRKKVRFHLDDLVYIRRQVIGGKATFSWFCKMLEPCTASHIQLAVACGNVGLFFDDRETCEENALEHLSEAHRAVGGETRRKRNS